MRDVQPKTITFTHRSPTFVIRSHQSSFPYTSNLTISYIFRQAEKLLRIALSTAVPEKNGVTSSTSNGKGANEVVNNETKIGPFGNVQLSFSGLERLEEGQKGIAGFFAASSNSNTNGGSEAKKEKGKGVVVKEEREKVVKRAKSENIEDQVGRREEDQQQQHAAKKRKLEDDANESHSITIPSSPSPSPSPPPVPRLPTFTCPRSGCSRILEIPASTLPSLVAANYSQQSIKEALKRVEDEERDYHLARDMVEEERKRAGWRTTNSGSGNKGGEGGTKKKRVKEESAGGGGGGAKKGGSSRKEKEGGQLGLGSFFKK